MSQITFEQIRNNDAINTYIQLSDKALAVLGYTVHSASHTEKVGHPAALILKELGHS